MTSSLDQLFTYLRGTLHEPPAIVLDAEREVMAMRDQMRAMQQALDAVESESPMKTALIQLNAEEIAREYDFDARWNIFEREWIGRCAEFPSLTWGADTERQALDGIKRVVTDCVAGMLRNSETPPKARGDNG